MKYATTDGSATNASNATSARQVDVNGGGLVYGESGNVNFRIKESSGNYSYTSARSLKSNIDSLWTCVVSPQTQQCTFPLYAYNENDKCIKVSFIFLPRADLWSITSNISWDFGTNKTANGLHQNGILKNGSMDYTYGVMMQMLNIYLVFMLVKMLEH